MKYSRTDITFDGTHFVFAPGVYQSVKKDWSDVDVDHEIKKAERWLTFHHPKKDYRRFLLNWLNSQYVQLRRPVVKSEKPVQIGNRTTKEGGAARSLSEAMNSALDSLRGL